MEEARASWNTIYLDPSGFEAQFTLRDEDEESLRERVADVTAHILESGARRSPGGAATDLFQRSRRRTTTLSRPTGRRRRRPTSTRKVSAAAT
jgi:hypothetical protein